MMSRNLMRAIDEDVLTAARAAAEQSAARFVIGWWNDGAQRRVMLLPEGHHVTDEPPFVPLILISPTGHTKLLAA
jgi:hypothetical protein